MATANKITIPAQPSVLLELNSLLSDPNPSISAISEVINRDASLSATILRTVNTPFFSRSRNIGSVKQALSILGIANARLAILGACLRAQYSNIDARKMEVFWRHSELSAIACKEVAARCSAEISDAAYIAGLFHDCAVPLFVQTYHDYSDLFKQGMRAGDCRILIEEERRYSTNHCLMGSAFCKSWSLPEEVCSGVLYHHAFLGGALDLCIGQQKHNSLTEKIASILVISDKIIQNLHTLEFGNRKSLNLVFEKYRVFMDILSIDIGDMLDIRRAFLDKAFGS